MNTASLAPNLCSLPVKVYAYQQSTDEVGVLHEQLDKDPGVATNADGVQVVLFEEDRLEQLILWASTYGHFVFEVGEIDGVRGPIAIWLGAPQP
jgi:hypothetical protein